MLAVSLTKISGDLALMGSGPRAGIGELFLPALLLLLLELPHAASNATAPRTSPAIAHLRKIFIALSLIRTA